MNSVRQRLNQFGSAPLCNLRSDRAFRVGTFLFPLCARCTGVIAGGCFAIVTMELGITITRPFVAVVGLMTPMFIDWGLQYFRLLESTNFRRFVTGLLCGFAIAPYGITI